MTKIEWANLGLESGVTWNPIRARNTKTGKTGWHCEKVSPACDNCYAERLNVKRGDTGGTGLPYKPGHRQKGDAEVYLDEKALLAPLHWRKPRGVFVCSMTDLFADFVTDEMRDKIFAVMALCPQQRFAILTKRAEKMQKFISRMVGLAQTVDFGGTVILDEFPHVATSIAHPQGPRAWPLPNVWAGVTVEDQQRADERIPHLLATPAAVRFVSCEPLLGPIDLYNGDPDARLGGHEATNTFLGNWWEQGDNLKGPGRHGVDWVIAGGESGPGARPMHPDWARSLRDQCDAAGVPFFMKQMHVNGRLVKDIEQFPHDLRVREFPHAR